MTSNILTQETVRNLFTHNPSTGWMIRRKNVGCRWFKGQILESEKNGYICVWINGKSYALHRVIWLYYFGTIPEFIDHKDGNKKNNRLENLRPATKLQNCQNRKLNSNTTSGYKGSSFHKASGKWRSYISNNKRIEHLGLFDTAKEAHEKYCEYAEKYHGEFKRLK